MQSFSSIECVLGSSSTGKPCTKQGSTLDKIADDLLCDNSLQDRSSGARHARPTSEMINKCSRDERLYSWLDDFSRRNARYFAGDALSESTQLMHLPALKLISYTAKKARNDTMFSKSKTHSPCFLPLSKRTAHTGTRRGITSARVLPVVRLHSAISVTVSGKGATYSAGPSKSSGVKYSPTTSLHSVFSAQRERRSFMPLHTRGSILTITSAPVDRKSTRLNSSHSGESRMPSSA